MKKILVLLLVMIFMSGCVPIKDMKLEEVVNNALSSKYKLYNTVNQGFKFYLPRGLKTVIQDELNVVIKSKYYDYYLYVDLVSYYNKVEMDYKQNDSYYYSELLDYDEKKGIINIIKSTDDNVIIKVAYNYANIEVKVRETDINETLMNVMVVLGSIDYQDDVIKSLLDEDILSSIEEKIVVFDTETSESKELDVADDTYTGNEDEDYDPDVIGGGSFGKYDSDVIN